jgi:hypothetical protein
MVVSTAKTEFKCLKMGVLGGFMALALVACGTSPAGKQMEAQAAKNQAEAELTAEKQMTYEEYKECVRDSDGDEEELRACESMLRLLNEMPKDPTLYYPRPPQ